MLNRLQTIPYELEFRDTLDAALYHFEQLSLAAGEALVAQDAARLSAPLSQAVLSGQVNAQRLVFDHLDAFLGAFARVSLLVFPVSSTDFAKGRAATMQSCLQLSETSLLADRELRGSWTHHDERLDFAVETGTGASGQIFTRSTEATASKLDTFLRVVELDTLVVRYRARKGEFRSANLRKVYEELLALNDRRVAAFDQLPMPDVV